MCNELAMLAFSPDGDSLCVAQHTVEATPARSPATVDSIKEGLGRLVDITHGIRLVGGEFIISPESYNRVEIPLFTGTERIWPFDKARVLFSSSPSFGVDIPVPANVLPHSSMHLICPCCPSFEH